MTAEQRRQLERVLDSLCNRWLALPYWWNYGRARRDAIRKIEKILKGAK